MKMRIQKNIVLQQNEKILRDYHDLKAIRLFCSLLVTNKRLVIFKIDPHFKDKGKWVKRKSMDELDLRSIHRFEHYLEYARGTGLRHFFGFLLVILFAAVGYGVYSGLLFDYLAVVEPYRLYLFGGSGVLIALGLVLLFTSRKFLAVTIKSGFEEKISLQFVPNKRNEEAIKYIAGQVHVA